MSGTVPTHEALAAVAAVAAGSRGRAVSILRALVAAGRDGEAAVLDRVVAEAARLGAVVERTTYDPAAVPVVGEFASGAALAAGHRTCLVARLPGTGGGRSLVAFAHPDSEPVSGLDRWRHDAFSGPIVDGRLHGWGVADDLAGIAAMIAAAGVLAESGIRLAGDLTLAATPSKRNARGVAALLHAGLSADAALYLHPAESGIGLAEIKAFTAGQIEFRIVVDGAPPPTTEPHQTGFAHRGVNAIETAMIVVEALRALGRERAARIRHPVLEAAVGRSTNLMLSHLAAGDADRLTRSPSSCIVGAALSFPPTESLAAVQAEIEAAVAGACRRDPWLAAHPPRVIWDAGVSGAEVPEDHAFYRITAAAVADATRNVPRVNPMHTGSDIRNPIVQKGIPTLGLGPLCGALSQNGDHDEWVDVEDYLLTVEVTARLAAAWCGVSDERRHGPGSHRD